MWLLKQKQPVYHSLENLFDFPIFNEGNTFSSKTAEFQDTVDNIHVSIALPGIKKEDISVEFIDEQLIVEVKSNSDSNTDKEDSLVKKLSSNFYRKHQYYIGDVDFKNSNANLVDGILSITIPKKEKEKPQVVQIS